MPLSRKPLPPSRCPVDLNSFLIFLAFSFLISVPTTIPALSCGPAGWIRFFDRLGLSLSIHSRSRAGELGLDEEMVYYSVELQGESKTLDAVNSTLVSGP